MDSQPGESHEELVRSDNMELENGICFRHLSLVTIQEAMLIIDQLKKEYPRWKKTPR
jgi:hypothetical protein